MLTGVSECSPDPQTNTNDDAGEFKPTEPHEAQFKKENTGWPTILSLSLLCLFILFIYFTT